MSKGRIIKGVGGLYFVDTGEQVYTCQARGLFRKQRVSPLVGDFVEFDIVDMKKGEGYLKKLLPRKSELLRPRISNVDAVVIVFAITQPALSPALLDRFIVQVERLGLKIILCFNKLDLAIGREGELLEIYRSIGYDAVTSSALDMSGIDELSELLKDKVSVLAGPSGVGKSSIINSILSETLMETGEISKKIERGKHTTRHAEILRLKGGGFIADTPGFASVSTLDIPVEEFKDYFIEFGAFQGNCRYRDCMHDAEPDCAVKAAVGKEISKLRYNSYLNMIHRSEND